MMRSGKKAMNDIIWIRWYKLYADGMVPSSDDNYEYRWFHRHGRSISDMTFVIETDIEEDINLYEEGEHYRCFRWEVIDKPPQSYVERMIEYHTSTIKHATAMIEYFKGIKYEG